MSHSRHWIIDLTGYEMNFYSIFRIGYNQLKIVLEILLLNTKQKMFISWQTYQGIKITTLSIIEVVQYLLSNNVPYVLTEWFCQDPLENYFGRQRSMGAHKDNPSIRDFGYIMTTASGTKRFSG